MFDLIEELFSALNEGQSLLVMDIIQEMFNLGVRRESSCLKYLAAEHYFLMGETALVMKGYLTIVKGKTIGGLVWEAKQTANVPSMQDEICVHCGGRDGSCFYCS